MVNNTISVASIAAPKLDVYAIQNGGKIIHVYDAYLIRLLSQVFQVPYNIYLPSDGEIGVKIPNGNWTGMIGMVHRLEVDLALGVKLTDQRFEVVHFSYPYQFSDTTFMTNKPKPDPTSSALIHPFPLILWILLLAVIFLFSCVLFLHLHRKETYQNILFMLFGSLLEKSIAMQLRKISLKLILSTWLIFAFVIINSYKAVLLSILTIPPLTGIKDIPDLAKAADQNSVNCYSYKGASTRNNFLESEIVTWRSIGNCLQQNVINSQDAEEAFIKDPSNKAFITSRSYLKPYEEIYFISEDSLFNSMHAFSVSKKFRGLNYLDERIHRLFAAGLLQKIEKNEQFLLKLTVANSHSIEPGTLKVLQFQHLKGAFIILFTGYAISTIVLFIEIAVKYYFSKSDVCFSKTKKTILKKM